MNAVKATVQLQNIWVIRAGKKGEADDLFLKHERIVLSDPGLGDLSKLTPDRKTFLLAYRALFPDVIMRVAGNLVGKFFRFIHEIHRGDFVLYPSVKNKKVYIGVIIGNYAFNESLCSKFPHQRRVRWRYFIPKAELSREAQAELGAARTFFKFRRHAEEINEMITHKRMKRF